MTETTEHVFIDELNKSLDSTPEWECLGEQILVKRIEDEDAETGYLGVDGKPIVKPDIAKLTSNKGIVVAVGEGRLINGTFLPWGDTLKPGDEVRFSRHGGTDVPMDDGEILLLFHWKSIFLKKRVTRATL